MCLYLPVALLLAPFFAAAAASTQRAPSSAGACLVGVNAPPGSSWRWSSGAEVRVYFLQGQFTESEIAAMLLGVGVWNDAVKSTGTGVSFVYAGQTPAHLDCHNCVNVFRGDTWKERRLAFFRPLRMDELGRLQLAQIEVDSGVTDLTTLRTLIMHELGHGMGLWDCPTCHKKSTIMGRFRGRNKSIEVSGPTPCDLETVSRGFATSYRTAASAK